MADVIDSYSESNYTSSILALYSARPKGGNSFACSGNYVLDSATFYLKKVGSPTGNAHIEIWSHSGTYGTSSVGNTLLATSDSFDISTLTTSMALKTLNFSGAERINLSAGYYVVVVVYSGGNVSNYLAVGRDLTGEHSGNLTYYTVGWAYSTDHDICFYVYGDPAGYEQICTETIAFVDTINKTPGIVKTEAVTIVDTLNKSISRVLSQVISLADIVVKGAEKVFAEAFSIVDSIISLVTKLKELTETILVTDIVPKTISRVFSEIVSVFDVVVKGVTKTFQEIVTLVESLVTLATKFKELTEAILVTDVLSKTVNRIVTEIVTVFDTAIKGITKIFQETVTLIESLVKGFFYSKILTETISFLDYIFTTLNHIWTRQPRPTTSFTKQSRPSTSYTAQARPTTSYTPQPRT